MLVKIRLNIPLKLCHSTAVSIIRNLALVTRPVNLPAKRLIMW